MARSPNAASGEVRKVRKTRFETLNNAQKQRYEALIAHLRGVLWTELDYLEPGFTKRLAEFADEAGLSVSTIRNIMDGTVRSGSQFLTLYKLALVLGYETELQNVFRKTNHPVTRAEAVRRSAKHKRKAKIAK